MNDVHLFAECNLAAPVFKLMAQIKRNPSFVSPKVAKYCELGLNERLLTPKLCSTRMDKGISDGASFAVEKIRTRGL